MSSDTTLVLGDLIEGALNALHQESERPLQTTIGADALTVGTDTQLTVADHYDRISAPMILEHGQELLLVVDKSADMVPIFTVIRGYAGTPIQVGNTGDIIRLEPTWSRRKVRNAILTCFRRTLNVKLPNLRTDQLPLATDPISGAPQSYVEMPNLTVDINRVFYRDPLDGAAHFIDGWDFFDDAGANSSTGKLLQLNWRTTLLNKFTTDLYVTYQIPYLWLPAGMPDLLANRTDDPAEDATIGLPLGASDLPELYAAAYVLLNRELSRIQMDRTEEWTTEATVRGGISLRVVQQAWTNFYAVLDEAREMQNVPRRLRYRPRRRL